MDASVNMKMSPAEYRLLRDVVVEAKEKADETASMKVTDEEFNSARSREARERSLRLNDLLGKL